MGHGRIHFFAPNLFAGEPSVDFDSRGVAGDVGGQLQLGQDPPHSRRVVDCDLLEEKLGRERSEVRTGVGMEQMKAFAQRAGGGGLAGGGAAVDGDNDKGRSHEKGFTAPATI